MVIGAGLETATIALTVPIIEAITNVGEGANNFVLNTARAVISWIGFSENLNSAILGVLTLAVTLFLLSAGFALLHQYLTAGIAHRLRREMKSSLFERLLYADYQNISARNREETLHDINVPADAVYSTIRQLGVLFTGIFNTLLMLGLMLYLSWWATLVIGLLVVLGVSGLRKLMDWRAETHGRTIYGLQGSQKKLEGDSIDGLRIVKAECLESSLIDRHRRLLFAEVIPTLRLTLFRHLPMFLNEAAAAFIVLLLGAVTFMLPSVGMTFPILAAFLLAIRRVSPAVASVNAVIVDLNVSRKSVEVIDEILNRTAAEERGSKPVRLVKEVQFENVDFSYSLRSEKPALERIEMKLSRGKITALVGVTGAGKSTIADLVLGLHRASSGRILIDGVDLSDIDIGSFRKRIGYVPQDAFLFNASIRDNITVWDSQVGEDNLVQATKLTDLYSFITSLPEGFETPVGDRGFALSGGQRQRIAIARAILRKPDLLILDEATSALDNRTEKVIYETITTLRDQTIILIIAHRLSTVRKADQIFVLDGGRILESGTHESLMTIGGSYSKLYGVDVTDDSSEGSVVSNDKGRV